MFSVLELMKLRRDNPNLKDPYKLGLVLPSEGLAGVKTAGMLAALHQYGYNDVFDAVYGSSAGAINGAYFLAGNSLLSSRGYDLLTTRKDFIRKTFSLWNIFKGKGVFDIDAILHSMEEGNPLSFDHLFQSAHKLKIVATVADTAEATIVPPFQSREDLLLSLRASAFIPIICTPNIAYKGTLYTDAGLSAPIPWKQAVDDGCTHILMVSYWHSVNEIVKEQEPWILRMIAKYHSEGRKKYPQIYEPYTQWHVFQERKKREFFEYMRSPKIIIETVLQTKELGLKTLYNDDESTMYRHLIENYKVMEFLLTGKENPLPWQMKQSSNEKIRKMLGISIK